MGRPTIVEVWLAPHENEDSFDGTWTLVIRNGNCARQYGAGMSYQILDEESIDLFGDDA